MYSSLWLQFGSEHSNLLVISYWCDTGYVLFVVMTLNHVVNVLLSVLLKEAVLTVNLDVLVLHNETAPRMYRFKYPCGLIQAMKKFFEIEFVYINNDKFYLHVDDSETKHDFNLNQFPFIYSIIFFFSENVSTISAIYSPQIGTRMRYFLYFRLTRQNGGRACSVCGVSSVRTTTRWTPKWPPLCVLFYIGQFRP